jgi:hypothetical protein
MMYRRIAHWTHLVVYECKQLWWSLCQNGILVKLMWISFHVGLVENKLVDDWARQAALEGSIFSIVSLSPLSDHRQTIAMGTRLLCDALFVPQHHSQKLVTPRTPIYA